MRIILQRYEADRALINRLYDISITTRRIARMKRFDADWLDALNQLPALQLSPAAQADLTTLRTTIANNTRQLDTQAATNAQVAPFLPFAPEIIQLEEARRRMETMDAEKAAGILNEAAKKLLAIRTAFQAQLADSSKPALPSSIRYNVRLITRAAEAVDKTQADLRAWFNFYNDYDPLFSWWMAAPYKEIDAGLGDYALLLRDKIAPTASTDEFPETPVAITPDPPQFHSVPDLNHLISIPNNEMRTITQRYNASRRGGRGGRGGDNRGGDNRGGDARGNRANDTPDQDTPNASPPIARGRGRAGGGDNAPPVVPLPQVPPEQFLAALQKIDFQKLSRNAQVDYLRLRHNAQVEIKRPLLPANTTVRKPDDNAIPGNPIGPAALQLDLEAEMIPYTPEQLIAIGQAEYAWCIDELKKAARDMGLGDDWRAAIERTKSKHAPPGKQPDTIRDIIRLDLAFLRDKNLITVPQVAEEALRMEMMSPQRQLINPFFTGGSLISVSFPTSSMSHEAKLESMRGNNWGFALATVHHELIPGHNLQGFTAQRFSGLRGGGAGGTPFWGEGWACYWEMIFLNNGFAKTPEDRAGFLWWRMMRCSRIVFSFNFHLGKFSPNECVDYIVDSINSERKNAAAEVRRSFGGGYSPVYQAAYLLGAIQLRSLHNDLVQSGRMDQKTFHDTILENGPMPIALVRLSLTDTPLSPDMDLTWKFAGTHPGQGITAPFAAPRP
jgi:uncharacterized protein (DUF885 family)